MTDRRPLLLGVAHDHNELITLLARRRREVEMAQLDLDERAGFALGHTGKLEQLYGTARSGKRWGRRTTLGPIFDAWLGGLRVGLAVVPLDLVEDPSTDEPAQLSFAFADDLPAPPPRPKSGGHHVHHIKPADRRRPPKATEEAA